MHEFTAPDLVVPEPAPPSADHGPGGAVPAPVPVPAVMTDELVPGSPVLGAPTVDSDADGVPDTSVSQIGDELVLASDLDHDGHADAVTLIGTDAVVTSHHGDPAPPPEHPWDAPPLPPPSVDTHTGEWIRG